MKSFNALTTGFRSTNKNLRMVGLLYLVNLLIAAIFAWGFRSLLTSAMGDSMSLERLVKDFDYTVYTDFMVKYGGRIDALTSLPIISWLVVFYLLINTLFDGGALATLYNPDEGFSLRTFFENCGTYLSRFLRLLFIFIAIFVLVFLVVVFIVGIVYSSLTLSAVSEVWPFTLAIVLLLLCLFVAMLVVMMADYAKVLTVVHDATSMIRTAWAAITFVFRHFFSTVTLQLSVVLTVIVSILLYLFLEDRIGMSTPLTILVMLLIQQLSVGFRIYARMVTFGGQLGLAGAFEVSPLETQVPAPMPEPAATPAPMVAPQTITPPAIPSPSKKPAKRRAPIRKPRVVKRRVTRKSR